MQRPAPSSTVLVVGTGTGVGKTHVALALLDAARAKGIVAIGLKPVESGLDHASPPDWKLLAARSASSPPPPCYGLGEALSPHLAARRAGTEIRLEAIADWTRGARPAELTLVETAGGLLSPLTATLSNLDLVATLSPANVVVVSTDRLGVLHDVAAVLLALQGRGLGAPVTIALNAPATPDGSTSTNAAELAALHRVPVFVLPRASPEAPSTVEAARPLLERLLG